MRMKQQVTAAQELQTGLKPLISAGCVQISSPSAFRLWRSVWSSLVWTDPAEFVLRLGAGVHEGLRDDVQRSVHHLRHVDVEHEVGVPQDVHPKAQRQAEETERLGSERLPLKSRPVKNLVKNTWNWKITSNNKKKPSETNDLKTTITVQSRWVQIRLIMVIYHIRFRTLDAVWKKS